MSKQSETKVAQGYRKEAACCMECKHFSSNKVPLNRWPGDIYVQEKNKRCKLGGFATQSTAHCSFFDRK